MAYPEDNEDDLQSWLARQSAPNLATSQPQAAGPGVWSKARDMMDKQSAMQYQAQDYSKLLGPQEAAPDRTGGDFRTILAMALDLFGNKGRGAGQLMAAGNQSADAKEAMWKRENGPAAQMQRQLQVKQLEGADRAQFNQDRSQLGAQIGQEVQLAGAQQAQGNADRTFERQEERDMAGDVQHQLDQAQSADQFATGQKTTHEQMAQNATLSREQMAQTKSLSQAQMGQTARFHADALRQHDADRELDAQEKQRSRVQQQQLQEMGFEHSDQTQDKSLDAQRMIHELTHPQPAAPAGYRIADPVAFKPVSGNAGTMSKIYEKSGNAKQIQASIDELTRLRTEPSSAANKSLYDATIKTLIGDRSQEGSTGVLSGTEFERYIADLPAYGETGNFSTWRGAVDKFQGRDPALETLSGFKERFRKSNAAEFSAYGLSPEDAQPEQQDPYIKRYSSLKLVQ